MGRQVRIALYAQLRWFNHALIHPDSLLAAIPHPAQSTQSSSQDRMEVDHPPHRSTSRSTPSRRGTSGSLRHRSPLPMTPPPVPSLPRNNRRTPTEIRTEPQHPRATFNMYPSPGEARRSSSPSSQHSVSDTKRRRMSFASYRAQSSPTSTPSVASVPRSPSLTNMVADAINRTGQLNQASPSVPSHSRSQSHKPNSGARGVPPLPRRTSLGRSSSTNKPRSWPSGPAPVSSFRPQSQSQTSPMEMSSAKSPGALSVGSAQAVEEALTQNVFSSASSRAPNNSSHSSPGASSSISSPSKPAQPQPSLLSSGGSQALESHSPTQPPPQTSDTQADTEPLPDVKPVIKTEHELEYPHSGSSSPAEAPAPLAPEQPSPPLPRRRARSKTPAQQLPVPTRVLRSRSKSQTTAPAPPAAAQSKSLPLPRTTRSRAGSKTSADVPPAAAAAISKGQRATSKPRSTGKRAGSAGPAPGGRKGARAHANPGALAVVDEQPDEASQPAATQQQPQPQQMQGQGQRPPTFRSGTLQLPRRQQVLASHAQSQSQSQSGAQVAAGRFGEDEGVDVKVKRELLDAEPLLGQSQSQSQDGGAWTGFSLNPMELLTQKPFPSQSQGWGSS